MLKSFSKLFVVCFIFLVSNANAILEIEITQGADTAMPIAVDPFVGEGLINNDFYRIADTVSNDLKNSGLFKIVHDKSKKSDEVNYQAWQLQKINAVVKGGVKQLSSNWFLVTFKLFDVYNKKELVNTEYKVKKEQLRKFAHHISDVVYEKLTGERGVFSTKIAYVLVKRSGKESRHYLQVSDSDGHNTHTLLSSEFPLMSPVWSPDGEKISYVSFEGNRAAIYIQDVASGKRYVLSKFPGINGAPAWSPDGKKMALVLTKTGYPKVYILDLATKKLERITDGYSLDTEPNWAPDGKSLIFTSSRSGGPQIYRYYFDTKKTERVTFIGTYNARASFTPDGKSIVLLHREGELFSIAVWDLKNKRIMLLTQSGLNDSPSMAPNGKMVVYATNYKNRGMLAEVSVDGKVKLLLPAGEGMVQEPAWSPFLNRYLWRVWL